VQRKSFSKWGISSVGETGGLAEIGTCAVSLKMAVSPRDENG
jgi:hypothetical protein